VELGDHTTGLFGIVVGDTRGHPKVSSTLFDAIHIPDGITDKKATDAIFGIDKQPDASGGMSKETDEYDGAIAIEIITFWKTCIGFGL
jgi:hypothetical protein